MLNASIFDLEEQTTGVGDLWPVWLGRETWASKVLNLRFKTHTPKKYHKNNQTMQRKKKQIAQKSLPTDQGAENESAVREQTESKGVSTRNKYMLEIISA